ncbi:MAG: T9SS type A sorting domain-containing protein [Saprospiraceae bacterium]|nr:T9SS type A sorting domain-containing protein [Saprospiraceae bacterium]
MKKSLLILLLATNIIIAIAQEKITIIGNQQLDPNTKFMQGFLHGGSAYLDSVKVAKLKPAFWRIGAYFLAGSGYTETKRFNPKITVNINDLYMIVNNIPSQSLSQPWVGNWASWDNLVTMIANNSLTNNEPVDVWDVWGEPDNFWTGTYSQWIEMYRRTDSIITSIIPNAKIIGPEFGFGACNFDINSILQFLDNLYSVGTTISGVSWHEFCNPEDVPIHVQQVRDSLSVRPWLGNLDILIPEYAGPANHTIPGWNVGWLYYFEKSKVDWVSHGCWDENDGTNSWTNCQYGLNGLFMWDNITPQPNYWVHRAYAELDSNRIICNSTHIKTVALASKNNSNQEMKILIGRYENPNLGSHNASANVEVKITNFPYCSNCTIPLVIQQIPSNNVNYSIPLNSLITTFKGNITFAGDSSSVFLNGFIDGDSYTIYLNPSKGSILTVNEQLKSNSKSFEIYPNPSSSILHVSTISNKEMQFQIFNALGILVKEVTIYLTTQIDISNFANGVYFISVKNQPNQTQKFIKQ